MHISNLQKFVTGLREFNTFQRETSLEMFNLPVSSCQK